MEHLYAVRFSNGLTKVGRSKAAEARIAQHADRLSVAGLDVSESHTGQCLGHAVLAEATLIARCSGAATGRRKSEWFVGLDFAQVKGWVKEACEYVSSERAISTMNAFARIRSRLGLTQSAMADGILVTQANVSFYEVRNQTVPPEVARRLIEFAKSKGLVITFDDIYAMPDATPDAPSPEPLEVT